LPKTFLSILSRWPATVAVAGSILFLSHVPAATFPVAPPLPHFDKLVHGVEYLALGVLLLRSLLYEWRDNPRPAAIMAVTAGVGFALLDECSQGFVGRSVDILDLAADAAGLLCGFGLLTVLGRRREPDGP